MKMGRRGVRGRVMWLTPSFGDRVEHGERLLNAAKGTSLCAWFVKWVTCRTIWAGGSVGPGASTGHSDWVVSLLNHSGFLAHQGFGGAERFDRLRDRWVEIFGGSGGMKKVGL